MNQCNRMLKYSLIELLQVYTCMFGKCHIQFFATRLAVLTRVFCSFSRVSPDKVQDSRPSVNRDTTVSIASFAIHYSLMVLQLDELKASLNK
jgi:hypothetical protein